MRIVQVIKFGEFTVQESDTLEVLMNRLSDGKSDKDTLFVCAKVDGVLKELNTPIGNAEKIEFLGIEDSDGAKIYQRSLSFMMIRAAKEVVSNARIKVSHSLSKGLYCTIHKGQRDVTHEECRNIKELMKTYIANAMPIRGALFSKSDAEAVFKKQKMDSKVKILKYREEDSIRLYELDGFYDYFYGYMVPNTKYLQSFDLIKYGRGVILCHPTHFSPDAVPEFEETPKMASVFEEMDGWLNIMGIPYIYNLNDVIKRKKHKELILIAEALQEKKIAEIADEITRGNKKVILIAGPSSSGKTTFANRLGIQLRVNGLRPVTIGTDDYFVDRVFTPRDENGELDFESIDAVNVKLFGEDINKLLDGEEIDVGRFDFGEGKRYLTGEKMRIDSDQPIIIEGIHGLNDKLTQNVFKRDKYKIYISALTLLNIDEHNRIPTTQARMLRRIVRDNTYRGHSARRTISMWQSVRRGEEKNIFPFQETADAIFNSALPYELSILKNHAMPLLKGITPDDAEYQQAHLLIKFLQYFESIEEEDLVPENSILREFIGGSIFAE